MRSSVGSHNSCQPWSIAGKKLGTNDPRHLWPEYYRLIQGLRPRWVIGENVPGLLNRGADPVIADLEAQGYTCWPIVLGADDIGASHRRKRVFFIARLADSNSARCKESANQVRAGRNAADNGCEHVADTDCGNCAGWTDKQGWQTQGGIASKRSCSSELADTVRSRSAAGLSTLSSRCKGNASQPDDASTRRGGSGAYSWPARPNQIQHAWEEPRTIEPTVGRAVDGPARRLARWRRDALKGLGNMVVPQVAELIGRTVMMADANEQT